MIDFQKLAKQIEKVSRDSLTMETANDERLVNAVAALNDATAKAAAFAEKLEKNQLLALWPVATPLEPLEGAIDVSELGESHTVVAADGSQIMPSHHEIYNCYLLNAGTVMISYGVKQPPLLESTPHLYHRPEDLYPLVDRRRVHIDELYVSLERNLLEMTSIRTLAAQAATRALPAVAFLDGSLIPWSLDKMPDNYQQAYVSTMIEVMEALRGNGIPLVGYISHSRASDLVNALRIWCCPYPYSHCQEYCRNLNEEEFPCSQIWPVTDRQLLYHQLWPRSRSAAFLSGANFSRALPADYQICFVYVHVGHEIARLEMPAWVVRDSNALEFAISSAMSQAEKGAGYPVTLSEAHNQAVIRSPDRARFFQLLEHRLIGLGVERIRVSPKEARKRQGVI